MSESFYNYLVDTILANYFSLNPAKCGEHYCVVIESNERRKAFIEAIKLSKHSKPLTIHDIYEGDIPNGEIDKYDTVEFDADDEGASVPFIIADIDSGNGYLPTIRNSVNTGKDYCNYATFFIIANYATVDTLSTASINLQSSGMPFNAYEIRKCISKKIKDTSSISDKAKAYINYAIDQIVEDVDSDSSNLFEFEDILTVLQNNSISNQFNDLGFFTDQAVNELFPIDNINKRVRENAYYYDVVNTIMSSLDDSSRLSSLEKYLDEKLSMKIDGFNNSNEWKNIDYQEIKNSVTKKKALADLIIDHIDFFDNEKNPIPDSDLISKTTGKDKKQTINHIVCRNDDKIFVRITFNKEVKPNYEVSYPCNISGVYLRFELNEKPVYIQVGKDNNKHTFVFTKIAVKKQSFDNIVDCMKLTTKGEISLKVPVDLSTLDFGYGSQVIPISDDVINWDENYRIIFKNEDADDDNVLSQIIKFQEKDVKFLFHFDSAAIMNKSALELFEMVWTKKHTFWDARLKLNSEYTYSVVSDGEEEVSTPKLLYRNLLLIEQKMVSERCLSYKWYGDLNCNSNNLLLNKKLESIIGKIFDYYTNKKSIPTLTYLDSTIKDIYVEYLNAIVEVIKNIPTDRGMTYEEYSLTKLGVIEDTISGKNWLSPFHPIMVAFMLQFCNSFDTKDYQNNVLKLIGPYFLMPYITINDINMSPLINAFSDEVKTWLCYEQIKGHEFNHSSNIATKMVKDKLIAFIDQFHYLFLNKECPVIINLFGINDDSNIVKGIVQFIIAQYVSEKDSKVQRIELHEYVDDLLEESFFEKLNRLASDDLIQIELDKIGQKIEKQDKYTSRNIIHQLFSRVVFYKHKLDLDHPSDITYSHVSFFQMNTGEEMRYPNMNELSTELSMDGLISIPSTVNKGKEYNMGYGTQGVCYKSDTNVFSIAKYMNELYSNERGKGNYRQYTKNGCLAKNFKFTQSVLLNKVYDMSNWVTFLNPEVDLDFFYKQKELYIVHYTDQYTLNTKYDSITVTKHIERYKSLMNQFINKVSPATINNNALYDTMLSYFNSLNGSWLMDENKKQDFQVREKVSIVAAVITSKYFLSRNEGIIWIPISLEEILRVTTSIGLQKDYLFSVKALKSEGKPLSDDLLMIGFQFVDDKVTLYFYPVEVKFSNQNIHSAKGEMQVSNTYKLFRDRLFGDLCFVKKIYRVFFASQLLANAHKLRANDLLPESDFKSIEEQRFKLLNADYKISRELPIKEMGVASLMTFNTAPNSIKMDVLDDIPICHFNINELEFLKIIDGSIFNNSSFLDSELIPSNSYLTSLDDVLNSNSQANPYLENENDDEDEPDLFANDENEKKETEVPQVVVNPPASISIDSDSPETIEGNMNGVTIKIGDNCFNHQNIFFYPNNTRQVSHPNMGIIGTMGTGKTQFARSIIAQFSKESENNVNKTPIGMLVFDYKGDYIDSDFLKEVKGKSYNSKFPFNPLKLIVTDQVINVNLPALTAERIVDSMAKAFGLGDVQSITIHDTIMDTYAEAGITDDPSTWSLPTPTMDKVITKYLANNEAKDKVYKIFKTLSYYQMFTNDQMSCVSLFEWLNSVKVIDLTLYEDSVKKLIVSLILDLFYAEMRQLRGSNQKDGFRELRVMILVDEAHQFMKMKFNSLRKIISEGRMFGVGMILSTQNLSDFKSDEDYSAFIKSWVVHNVNNPTRSEMAAIFGNSDPNLEQHIKFINKAKVFESICKIGNFVTQMKDLPYFELIKVDNRFKS
jgi:DNA phosphorothioation-dependent restriction protein DptH